MRRILPALLVLVPFALAGCPERPGVKKDEKPAAKRAPKADGAKKPAAKEAKKP